MASENYTRTLVVIAKHPSVARLYTSGRGAARCSASLSGNEALRFQGKRPERVT